APGAAPRPAPPHDGRRRGDRRGMGDRLAPRASPRAGRGGVHDRRARVPRRAPGGGEGEGAVPAGRRGRPPPRGAGHGRRRRGRDRGRAPGGPADRGDAGQPAPRPPAGARDDARLLAHRARSRPAVALPAAVHGGGRDPRRHQGERGAAPLRGRDRLPAAVRHRAGRHPPRGRAAPRAGRPPPGPVRVDAAGLQRQLHVARPSAGGPGPGERDRGDRPRARAHRDLRRDRRPLLPAARRAHADLRAAAKQHGGAGRVHHGRRPGGGHEGPPRHRARRPPRRRRAGRMTGSAVARLRGYLEPRRGACLQLLEELIAIESYATQRAGVEATGEVLDRELGAIGFTTVREPGTRVGPADRWLEALMLPGFDFAGLAAHRVSRKRGAGRGRALVLGDLDTAFPPGSTGRFPFRVADGRAYGPGAAGMKGRLVTAVFALRALAETGLEAPAEIVCVWSADEQAGSLTARAVIEAAAREADWAFCLECAREGGKLMGARAQIGVGLLEVSGREAHAGSAYGEGASAIEAMARKITAIHALTDPGREVYLNVGTVRGGWRRSVVAGRADATLDVR